MMTRFKKIVGISLLLTVILSSISYAEEKFHVLTSDNVTHVAMSSINDVAIAADGSIYVLTLNSVKKLNSSGTLLLEWGIYGDGQFSSPSGITIDSSENIYVVDTYNNRIQKFDSQGNFIAKWSNDYKDGSTDGLVRFPESIAVDINNNVYNSDTGNNRIQKLLALNSEEMEYQIIQTGQKESFDRYGNTVTDSSLKDDGYYQSGKKRSYSRSVIGVVTDHATGLEWQDNVNAVQKQWLTNENMQNALYDNTSGDTATTYCSSLILDGTGWRLPTLKELETLLDYGSTDPSVPDITENTFQYISPNYWSSTSYAGNPSDAWGISFYLEVADYGYSYFTAKNTSAYVRCVRGEPLAFSSFSRDDNTDIVTDATTGLQWQDNSTVVASTYTWTEAIDYCENTLSLGDFTDWRLPNKNELSSLVDYTRLNPAIDNSVFKNTLAQHYWSSTTTAYAPSYAWFVRYGYGFSDLYSKSNSGYARCVRTGQVETPGMIPSVIMYLLN